MSHYGGFVNTRLELQGFVNTPPRTTEICKYPPRITGICKYPPRTMHGYRGYAADVTSLPVAILSGRGRSMGKSCCAIGCTNRYSKGCGLSFYRFPEEPAKRAQWIAAVSRKNWQPTEHAWICISKHAQLVASFYDSQQQSIALSWQVLLENDRN